MNDFDFFIQAELSRVGLFFKLEKRDIKVVCPFHADTTPSCSIKRIPPGIFHCWSCHAKGVWNKFAEKIGAQRFNPNSEDWNPFTVQDSVLHDAIQDDIVPKLPDESDRGKGWPYGPCVGWESDWRGIDQALLKDLKAKAWWDQEDDINRILLPVEMNSELIGWTARDLDVQSKAWHGKWRHMPGMASLTALYPYDYLMTPTPVLAIVEGPGDALNLIQAGIPTLAIFGANNWSEAKVRLLALKGIKAVLLLLDNDEAGKRATPDVAASISKVAKVFTADLGNYKDPGSLDTVGLNWIRERVNELLKHL